MEYSSRPHAVTVFRRGAVVERRVEVPARTGPLVLPGLPLSLVDSSIAVQCDHEQVRVASARVRLHARPREDAPEAPDAEALRSTQEELARARRRRDQLRVELELLTDIPMPQRPRPVEGQAPPPSPLQARLSLDTFVDGEARQRHEGLAELSRQIVDLERKAADLQDRIRRHQGARATRPEELTKSVHVELHAKEAKGSVELRVRYRVDGCRWVPRYALRLRGDEARLELRAAIAQASGEDWEAVQLTLSTALPQAYSALPSLPAARIGKVQPPPARRPLRPPPEGAEALFGDADRAIAALPAVRPLRLRAVEALAMPDLDEVLEGTAAAVSVDTFAASGPPMGSARAFDAMEIAEEAMADDEAVPLAEPSPVAAPPPSPQRARRSGMAKKKGRPAPKLRAEVAAEEPMEPPATGGWPDYGALHLPDPFGPGRGRLTSRHPVDQLVAALVEEGRTFPFHVAGLLTEHAQRAERVGQLSLPPGGHPVRPSHYDHAVRADRPVDVPSLGTWHTVSLAEATASCRLRYIGVPREEAAVYRIATLPNPCGHPLLPGPVEVYVDGVYILTASLPTTGSGQDVELGVGVEPAVHVARNTRFEERRSDERVVAMRELHHHIAIELRNDLGHPVDVEIRERVPIPDGDAEVAVDVVDTSPAWSTYDQEERGSVVKGGHRWRLELAPRSQQELSAHYVVRLYANHEVVGGDRREA